MRYLVRGSISMTLWFCLILVFLFGLAGSLGIDGYRFFTSTMWIICALLILLTLTNAGNFDASPSGAVGIFYKTLLTFQASVSMWHGSWKRLLADMFTASAFPIMLLAVCVYSILTSGKISRNVIGNSIAWRVANYGPKLTSIEQRHSAKIRNCLTHAWRAIVAKWD